MNMYIAHEINPRIVRGFVVIDGPRARAWEHESLALSLRDLPIRFGWVAQIAENIEGDYFILNAITRTKTGVWKPTPNYNTRTMISKEEI